MLRKDKTVQLVDLRTPGELQQTGKIEGAKHINFNSPDFQKQIGQLNKKKPVLLYCAAGGRSGSAADMLKKMGFQKVYDYTGGMNDWKSKGKKTVQ
jgi:rhodanese-related sulfurtransferase